MKYFTFVGMYQWTCKSIMSDQVSSFAWKPRANLQHWGPVNSIASKLDDFWFKMRLADLDVPASHLLIKGKPKEAFTSYAPNLSEALSKYCSLKGQGRAALFFKARKRNVGYVIDHLGDRPIDTYSSADAASFRDSLIARGLNVSSIARIFGTVKAVVKSHYPRAWLRLFKCFCKYLPTQECRGKTQTIACRWDHVDPKKRVWKLPMNADYCLP